MAHDDLTPQQLAQWRADEIRRIREIIDEYGVMIQYVFGDEQARSAPFAYTIGLHQLSHPELVIFGASQSTAAGVLNEVASRVRTSPALMTGELIAFERWYHRVTVETLPNPEHVVLSANQYYRVLPGESVQAYQLTYDDMVGRFPWEQGYETPGWIQPRPGEFHA
ncbi:DUF4262 domain-containing protein [Tsukamurella sp. NPDC003166]|uniref:DUF4262 domain-containing protein n=1 Tax=Tsukamurella sp. NPDC003166 TaxID=3154444 RepID=UPI00339DD2BD